MILLFFCCNDGAGASSLVADFDGDGVPAERDCDDESTAIGAMGTWYQDNDGDGVGGEEVSACERPEGVVSNGGDCDDSDGDRFPGNIESCDGRDNDCDAEADEDPDDPPTWCPDLDGDGQGAIDGRLGACSSPGAEYVAYDDDNYMSCPDCDDANNNIYYSTYAESGAACYDYVDTNCNGTVGDGCEEDCDDGIDNDEDHRIDVDDYFDCDI